MALSISKVTMRVTWQAKGYRFLAGCGMVRATSDKKVFAQ
jgi:hypothetical protein